MKLNFYKYQGTGNDFIIIDNRANGNLNLDQEKIAKLCHRRFGIGADGLMLLQLAEGFDFKMVYYNSDGKESSMCGNGGRCIVQFASDLKLIRNDAYFLAIDGPHHAKIKHPLVALGMNNVTTIEKIGEDYFLNTGSPHYVRIVQDSPHQYDLLKESRTIRFNERFAETGTNVNLIRIHGDNIEVRTYERGVEDETYSCGTGVTAAAIVANQSQESGKPVSYNIHTPGGVLHVSFIKTPENHFEQIQLIGPAVFVFKGEIDL